MIDEIAEFVFEILLDFVPNAVWKVLLLVLGGVLTAVGATMIADSTSNGAALIVAGTLLSLGSVVSLYRSS